MKKNISERVVVKASSSFNKYNSEIRTCASKYASAIGLPYYQELTCIPQENLSMLIADLFDAMLHEPMNYIVLSSYNQFIREIIAQYHFIIENMELFIEPWLSEGQPYLNSYELMEDIRINKHLYYFKTEMGYGKNGADFDLCNPMLAKTDVEINGHCLLVNDIFRIIHDLFGHAKEGYNFSSEGEENAWLEHLYLFTPLARPALTTEIRGQSNWFNFGKHLRNEKGTLIKRGEKGWIPPRERPYSQQKTGLLPTILSGVKLFIDINTNQIKAHEIKDWNPAMITAFSGYDVKISELVLLH